MVKTAPHNGPKATHLARPVRRCAACHERKSAAELLRFMRGGTNWVWQPATSHLAGRSLYLCPSMKCLNAYKGRLAVKMVGNEFLTELELELAEYTAKRQRELKSEQENGTSKAAKRLMSTMKLLATLKRELSMTR